MTPQAHAYSIRDEPDPKPQRDQSTALQGRHLLQRQLGASTPIPIQVLRGLPSLRHAPAHAQRHRGGGGEPLQTVPGSRGAHSGHHAGRQSAEVGLFQHSGRQRLPDHDGLLRALRVRVREGHRLRH